MAKDGLVLVIPVLLLAMVFTMLAWYPTGVGYVLLAVVFWVLTGFLVYFFRDPVRQIPALATAVISPADGQIIGIQQVQEKDFVQAPATQISIFMSPLNVHVNRIPIDGRVEYLKYQAGKFWPAYRAEAEPENEQMAIGIVQSNLKIYFKQIAGILARRIVCRLKVGEQVKRGERFGLIKFGSRVDVFLPLNVQIKVQVNQKVFGGETILGVVENGNEK
ncbi:phosphatidylserine decarboxylase family protein [candidate division KSB1 bacterium]|nr:phosphatidylserine decarboxylase family protein [candidate division KSB1 bacterium]